MKNQSLLILIYIFFEIVYIDASESTEENCNRLSFDFKDEEITRTWNMTISQISCGSAVEAPPGCLQYYYGVNTDGNARGVIQSFNYAGMEF